MDTYTPDGDNTIRAIYGMYTTTMRRSTPSFLRFRDLRTVGAKDDQVHGTPEHLGGYSYIIDYSRKTINVYISEGPKQSFRPDSFLGSALGAT